MVNAQKQFFHVIGIPQMPIYKKNMPFPRIENLSKIINVESFFTKNLPEIAQKWSKSLF